MSFETKDKATSGTLLMVWINIASIAVIAFVVFGYSKWQDQQAKLAELSNLVAQMQQAPVQAAAVLPQPVVTQPVVTRNATPDLTTIAPVAAAPVVATPAPVATPASVAVPQAPAADQIAAIVQEANPQVSAERLRNARRLETLAIIDAGVQELVDAVVAGNYDIHTNYEDEHFSGRIHFAFVGYEEDQVELEQFIAKAAEEGLIVHSDAVVDADGSVNGHIMLFDLVERSMENGTLAEQRAVRQMQQEAVEMLTASVEVGEELDAEGKQYYVVERGDSLAYIALQFYGNTNDYRRIYEANRDIISSPERIRVGQRILIPSA